MIKEVKRFYGGEEYTIRQLNIKHHELETSRITANEDTESGKLLYLKLQVFLWNLFSFIPSLVYLQSRELYCWWCASILTEREETARLRGV